MQRNKVPADYEARVYAGVLGKIIGVYLGRPFEGWENARIESELGEVWYYVHERLKVPLVVADDDISGTFTFLRALVDHGVSFDIGAGAVGDTWLNYLVEGRTVLWWGGVGLSTEHTAYHRLKSGMRAPKSGAIETNGQVVAEQIGAQIFIDGWGMVCPGDPDAAVTLAGRAASVSHDGEAVYAAQVIAAMEAMAFEEGNIYTLLARAQTFIPPGSLVYKLISDIVAWHAEEGKDWRRCFEKIRERYGYDKYGGNCHVIPNHAIIVMALLYGGDDFQKALMIANTAGWDTDCNAANVGCLLAIKNGLASIDECVDFRTPVADRMYLPTADGGRCITDALAEAYRVVNIGRVLRGQRPLFPDAGARFHFTLPGAVQGFQSHSDVATVRNEVVPRTGESGDALNERALAIRFNRVGKGRPARLSTPTFLPPDALRPGGSYGMECAPTLYSGQILRARVVADAANASPAPVTLFVQVYGDKDALETVNLVSQTFAPGVAHHFHVAVPDTGGKPVAAVGLEIGGEAGTGTVYLDWLAWDGTPIATFRKPDGTPGEAWRKAWVNAASVWSDGGLWGNNQFKLIQNAATDGFALTGCFEWEEYTAQTTLYLHLADRIGLLVCGRGLRRYVALTLSPDGIARLVERYDTETVTLAETPVAWTLGHHYTVSVTTRRDGTITAAVTRAESDAESATLVGQIVPERAFGGIGLLVAGGHGQFGAVSVGAAGVAGHK